MELLETKVPSSAKQMDVSYTACNIINSSWSCSDRASACWSCSDKQTNKQTGVLILTGRLSLSWNYICHSIAKDQLIGSYNST